MMEYDPLIHKRKSIRLKEYDYTLSAEYFITICTYNRRNLFGEIVNEETKLSSLGINNTRRMVKDEGNTKQC